MASANVYEFTDQNFDSEVLKSSVLVLIHFKATWCGPCKQLQPIVDKIADDYQGKIKVGYLDIDDSPEITAKYAVRSVPMCLVFQGGQKTGMQGGMMKREALFKLIGL